MRGSKGLRVHTLSVLSFWKVQLSPGEIQREQGEHNFIYVARPFEYAFIPFIMIMYVP